MLNLFASGWDIHDDGPGIYVNGTLAPQFLVLAIALFIIGLLLVAIFAYYLYKFSKQEVEVKIVNQPLIIASSILPIVATFFGMILLIFWGQAPAIFGSGTSGGEGLFAAYITLAILGFLDLIVSIVLMWIWLPKYAIGLTKDQIVFVGDNIPFSKITKVIKDDESGNLYVNYTPLGKRTLKKQKFPLTSVSAQFILANMNLLNQKAEQTSEKLYVQNFETTETLPNVEKVEPTPKPDEVKKPVAKKPAPVKPKAVGEKSAPVGKPVPKPKPVVLDEDLDVEISNHDIPEYKDEK